jgi:hypothetical protein
MASQFSSYDQMQQPSMASEMFGSPMRAQWTLQKLSVLSNSNWKDAIAGKGYNWSGVVGFRGIALGSSSVGSGGTKVGIGLARAASPSHFAGSFISAFDKSAALRFKHFGLFGEMGLLNANGNNTVSNTLGRIFGGGTIEASKFTPLDMNSKVKKAYSHKKGFKKSAHARGLLSQKAVLTEEAIKVRSYTISQKATGASQEANWAAARRELTEESKTAFKKNMTKGKYIRRAAKIGRLGSWAMMASLAFDVGSAIGSFVADTAGNAADRMEQKLSGMFNRQMEFGGKVGIGFYGSNSGTERQRALSAIGRGAGGGAAMGNEAGFAHIDSTW